MSLCLLMILSFIKKNELVDDCLKWQKYINSLSEWWQQKEVTLNTEKYYALLYITKLCSRLFVYHKNNYSSQVCHKISDKIRTFKHYVIDIHLGFIFKNYCKKFKSIHAMRILYCLLGRSTLEYSAII